MATPPAWEALYAGFTRQFVEAHGRVVDHGRHGESTSEAQAYAAFFALIANDQDRFAKNVEWTFANLAAGKPGSAAIAWRWGRRKSSDGDDWGVLDAEPATDADLWLAYTLLEAGRLWSRPDYARLSRLLMAQIAATRIAHAEGWGPLLLPGAGAQWRGPQGITVNPSYLVSFQLARLTEEDPTGPWQALRRDLPSLLGAIAPRGYAPDWVRYIPSLGWQSADRPLIGSYDAIRCYLWAGMAAKDDHVATRVRTALHAMRDHLRQADLPPERVNALSGETFGEGPVAYSAALIPFLQSTGEHRAAAAQQARLAKAWNPQTQRYGEDYYDNVLGLFAMAWLQGRLRIDAQGHLTLAWNSQPS